MFGTHVKIPSDWEHFRGRILNKFFVDYRTVERKIGGSLESHHQLERKDLLWLARTLARRFASPKKQIARLLGIDLSILDQLL